MFHHSNTADLILIKTHGIH